jgi:hypothetical protein
MVTLFLIVTLHAQQEKKCCEAKLPAILYINTSFKLYEKQKTDVSYHRNYMDQLNGETDGRFGIYKTMHS